MTIALRLALLTSLLTAVPDAAQDSWVGKIIIVKKNGIKIGMTDDNGQQVFVGQLKGVDYKVIGDRDGWIKVSDGRGNAGWFDKTDAVLMADAIGYFTDRIRQNPNDSRSYSCRAAAWRHKGELDIAIKDFDEALRIDPGAYAYANRGNAWRDKKEFDKAIADYNEAIRLDATDTAYFNNRGWARTGKKDYEKALADFNEAIRLDPKNGQAYNNRAWLCATCQDAKIRDGKKAVESAKHALSLNAHDSGWMDTLAAAHAENGDFVEAVRWQEKALEDEQLKNDADARHRLELYRAKKPYRGE